MTPLTSGELKWCGPCEFGWVRHVANPLERFGNRLDWCFGWSWLSMASRGERELVHQLKYGGHASLGPRLGEAMAREFLGSQVWDSAQSWGIVPIPLHRKRLRRRGYNQSEQLASGWATVTKMKAVNPLIRAKAGASLTKMSRTQRLSHGENPFSWIPPKAHLLGSIQGLLIVDDVVTTGSTLERAHSTVRQHWPGPLGFVTMLDAIH